MPSVVQKLEFHHAVWLEDAVHEQTQAKSESVKRRPLVSEHKWTEPQLKMTHTQDLFGKKRQWKENP